MARLCAIPWATDDSLDGSLRREGLSGSGPGCRRERGPRRATGWSGVAASARTQNRCVGVQLQVDQVRLGGDQENLRKLRVNKMDIEMSVRMIVNRMQDFPMKKYIE